MFFCFQKKSELELQKVNDKVMKTQEQLESITPLYEAQRDKEESASQQ